MKILKVILKIRYLIGLKSNYRVGKTATAAWGDVKHPAEFLTRW